MYSSDRRDLKSILKCILFYKCSTFFRFLVQMHRPRLAPMWQQSGTLLFCSCHGIAEFLVDELQIWIWRHILEVLPEMTLTFLKKKSESSLLKMSFNIEYSCHTITNIKQGRRLSLQLMTNWSLTCNYIDWRQCGNSLALCYFAVVMELPDFLLMNCKAEFGVNFSRCSPTWR